MSLDPTSLCYKWVLSSNYHRAKAIDEVMRIRKELVEFSKDAECYKNIRMERLQGEEYCTFFEELDAFLIGKGDENPGLISKILTTTNIEDLRAIEKIHGEKCHWEYDEENPDRLEASLDAAKFYMLNFARGFLAFALKPSQHPAIEGDIDNALSLKK
jgi:hypothetical protein